MRSLWTSSSVQQWREALARYEEVIDAQGVARLPDLDRWYRTELPDLVRVRRPAHATLADLVRLTEWKMARGVWRAPNLVLVRGNAPEMVVSTSAAAITTMPHATAPISMMAKLHGVGPATASALAAAVAPDIYPFFDELVAAQVPTLGKVAWTLGYYARYAEAIRRRATALGTAWSPAEVERAMWSHVGGKVGTAA